MCLHSPKKCRTLWGIYIRRLRGAGGVIINAPPFCSLVKDCRIWTELSGSAPHCAWNGRVGFLCLCISGRSSARGESQHWLCVGIRATSSFRTHTSPYIMYGVLRAILGHGEDEDLTKTGNEV